MEEKKGRQHPRLKQYNYSDNGAYFITFCVKNRQHLLGRIVGRGALDAPFVELSHYGEIIHNEIKNTPSFYPDVTIDNFIVMPNHVHLIISINNTDGAPRASRPTNALIPRIIAVIKRKTNAVYGFSMWQRSFYDHIIRNDDEYAQICTYIDENPARWSEDKYYYP